MLTEIPWIALSPNPLTLTVWVLLAVYGAKHLLKRNEYRRWRRLNAFTDSLFILGFIVLSMDLMWVVVCGFRFSWFYPLESGLQLFACAGRNVVGMSFCYLLIGGYFKNGTVNFTKNTTIAYVANLVFLAVWFGLSPGPWLTDWTYAIRHGYPQATVLTSFFISHVVGKTLLTIIFVTIWRKSSS